jgi:hypothetical protein
MVLLELLSVVSEPYLEPLSGDYMITLCFQKHKGTD